MEKSKFKYGDIIRIADQEDPAFERHHFYKVIEVQRNGYKIQSMQTGELRTHKQLKRWIKSHPAGFKNMREFIDNSYRLVTEAEIVLYGREKV